LDIEYLDRG